MIYLNRAQREALYRVYKRHNIEGTYREFRKTVGKPIGMDCVMVNVPSLFCGNGMWLGIETDGHTHS